MEQVNSSILTNFSLYAASANSMSHPVERTIVFEWTKLAVHVYTSVQSIAFLEQTTCNGTTVILNCIKRAL